MNVSKFVNRPRALLALGWLLIAAAAGACGTDSSAGGTQSTKDVAQKDTGGSATETNVASIHCYTDADCGGGRTCVHNPGQDDGSCSGGSSGPVHPGQSSDDDAGAAGPNIHGTAARCDVDMDCGGVQCLHPNGADQPGVCNVGQMGAR